MTNALVDHLEDEIARFAGSPPDSDFHCGYLAALRDVLVAVLAPPLVELAMAEAVQLLTDSDAPVSRADELLPILLGPAMRLVMAMRVEQVVKHGHTPANDLMMPPIWLPKQVIDHAQIAYQSVGVTGRDRDLTRAKRSLARTAALAMAAIDRFNAAEGV